MKELLSCERNTERRKMRFIKMHKIQDQKRKCTGIKRLEAVEK